MQRNPRQKIESHLVFLRTLPCICCGNDIETQAAHVRYSDARIAKDNSGQGQKPHDFFCVPMCNAHHREQTDMGDERKFWKRYGIDPLLYALRLWSVTGNYEMGCRVVVAALQAKANILMAG